MLYVALSRAKSAQGLYIITNNFTEPKHILENDPVITEMNRLRNNKLLQITAFKDKGQLKISDFYRYVPDCIYK